jgi:16S rRNA (adenine1518-N6/adenine1519-N6)-dimethyltransferase
MGPALRIGFLLALLTVEAVLSFLIESPVASRISSPSVRSRAPTSVLLAGWVERGGEWEWDEDDPSYVPPAAITTTTTTTLAEASATPKLPAGTYRPKQSLGQNYLKDPNTVAKILRAFHQDAIKDQPDGDDSINHIVELGPGAGALTDKLVETYGAATLQCIEIDERSVSLLQEKHPGLAVEHADVLQVNYAEMAAAVGQPLTVVGNLPYYITSQILFALADASHQGAVRSATVTMQWEVGQRMVAPTHCKDYGILSVVFQLYASVHCHFKIPPTVFYPQPKVDSALLGLHFLGPAALRRRLCGVRPTDLRRVVTATFQQRRKTVRNSLKKLCLDVYAGDAAKVDAVLHSVPLPLPVPVQQAADAGDAFCQKQALPADWATKRPEELSPGQFVELTRLVFGNDDQFATNTPPLGNKVWRKLKHGTS